MKINIKGVIVENDDKWIYDYLDIMSVCPKEVIEQIEKADGQRIDTYVNSGGGSIFAASEIYAAFEAYEGEVYHHVVGRACSAASYLICSGKSDIVRTGMFMYHNVSATAQGDYRDMEAASELLQTANRAIAAAYTKKTGMSEAQLLEQMDAETWLTASEAVERGFIDAVAKSKNYSLAACYGNELLPDSVMKKIRETVKSPSQREADKAIEAARTRLKLLNIGGKII